MAKTTVVTTCRKAVSQADLRVTFQRFTPTCHFCGVRGHIRPRCFTMMNFIENYYKIPFQRKTLRPKVDLNPKLKNMWVKKFNVNCLVSFSWLRACATNLWYFDSGCFRHIIGNQDILDDYKIVSEGQVTFGDGVKGRVLEKGTLNMEGFPRLKDVFDVDGLKANLIGISQICELDLNVDFALKKCIVMNGFRNYILEGSRSNDNCYIFVSTTHMSPCFY